MRERVLGARSGRLAIVAVACLVAAGCGGQKQAPSPPATAPTGTALEQALLDTAHGTPQLRSVRSVACTTADTRGRSWTCNLAAAQPRSVQVTVRDDGGWSADAGGAPAVKQHASDGSFTGDFTSGSALFGCCVPVP
jgi:hypothetical protein